MDGVESRGTGYNSHSRSLLAPKTILLILVTGRERNPNPLFAYSYACMMGSGGGVIKVEKEYE